MQIEAATRMQMQSLAFPPITSGEVAKATDTANTTTSVSRAASVHSDKPVAGVGIRISHKRVRFGGKWRAWALRSSIRDTLGIGKVPTGHEPAWTQHRRQ